METKRIDLIFEGGGTKGCAFAGALEVLEKNNYEPNSVAGTSAGSIIGALIAVGYKSNQIKQIMFDLDFNKMKDTSILDNIPLIGKALSLFIDKGIYEGNWIENWLADLLVNAPRPAKYFKDLKNSFKVIATDISRNKMLVLPDDIIDYGTEPGDMQIATAIRMSMSIPFFFEPCILKHRENDCYIVDGGLMSNYPIHLFDSPNPRWPTIGFRLVEPGENQPHKIDGPISMFAAIFSTVLSARDNADTVTASNVRTIDIPTFDVKTTDFDLSNEKKQMLVNSGLKETEDFFNNWDFDSYVNQYRSLM